VLLPADVSLVCYIVSSWQDIWRALTVPVNRFLFNYVATEARFSPAGVCSLPPPHDGVHAPWDKVSVVM
jgi:hypothetical protein